MVERVDLYIKNTHTHTKRLAELGYLHLFKQKLTPGTNLEVFLERSCKRGNLEIVRYLIDRGANIHALDDYALIRASASGHLEIVKLLTDKGANVHAQNDRAITLASRHDYPEIVKVLLDRGADIHVSDDYPLQWASQNGFFWR